MLEQEDKEWNLYLAHLDDRQCFCEENEECVCLSKQDFDNFIDKYYEDLREHLGECV